MKRAGFFLIKLVFVAVLFTLIFRPEWLGLPAGLFGGVRVGDVWREMVRVSETGPGWFLFWMGCAAGVKLLGIGCGIIRWKLLLRGQGLRLPWRSLAYQWFMGRAIGLLLPGTLGLDGFRLVASSRETGDPIRCATVIAVEKLTGIIALALLVFLTFPLGFRYFNINVPLLAVMMAILLAGIVISLLLLLQPRVIQILVSVLPVPGRMRRLINRFGAAATAYAAHRSVLWLALLFGLGVHLGTCATFQCTFMAIRAREASVADILFVSPLMIAASVLALTISGIGVREAAFGLVLGPKAGHALAILGGHLELWAGEIIPFVLSIPLLLWGGISRTEALKLREELTALRARGPGSNELPELDPESTRRWRAALAGTLTAGLLGGAIAGTLVALLEAVWIARSLPWVEDAGLFWWGGWVYGLLFGGMGFGLAGLWLFFGMLRNRPPTWAVSIALAWAGSFAAGTMVIGLFRIQRDVLAGHGLDASWLVFWVLVCVGAAVFGFGAVLLKGFWLEQRAHGRMLSLNLLAAVGWIILAVAGWGAGRAATVLKPRPAMRFTPPETIAPTGAPNVILCAIDALRADVLKPWNPDAPTDTPAIDALTRDAVVYTQAYAGATWTKPSFATMFTGRHPHDHGAETKTAPIRSGVPTLAGCLRKAGWHTAGFSNNPNTLALFGFDAGFDTYVDLKPDPLPGATPGATRLALYQACRKVFLTIEGKLRRGRLRVTDFYQPAETITNIALQWLDGERPKDRPFYLYLHYMDTHDPFMDHTRPGVGYARARMERPDPDRFREPMFKAYCSEVEYLDLHLSRLFQGLQDRGLYENTLIIFVADHGEEFFDHGGWWHGQTVYQELARVPLALKLPGNTHGGTRVEGIARLVDLMPTVLRVCGLENTLASMPDLPGIPLIDRSGLPVAEGTFAFTEIDFEGNRMRSIRDASFTLIQANPQNPRGVKPEELYDRRADPAEDQNLAGQPDTEPILVHMRRQMDAMLRGVLGQNTLLQEPPRQLLEKAPQVPMDQNVQEQMRALGYL